MRRLSGEVNATINEMSRVGGFSPAQWVMGRTPRYSAGEQGSGETAGQLSALQEKVDPTTIFAERMALRHEAKKAYVHLDSSERVARAMLRKQAPQSKDYQVGDLVSFQRKQGAEGDDFKRWGSASRIIGFERDGKVCWVICEGVPFCLATDQLLPANDSQALAYNYLHGGQDRLPPEVQQSYVDMRKATEEEEIDENEIPPLQPVDENGDPIDEQELPGSQGYPELDYSPESPAYEIEVSTDDAEERKRQALDDVPVDVTKRQRTEDAGPAPTESRETPDDAEVESEDEIAPPQTESRDQTVARARSRSRERRLNNSAAEGSDRSQS